METLEKNKIGDVVAKNFKTAAVFSKFGLDFCCGGQKTIAEAAEKKSINKAALLQELNQVLLEKNDEQIDYAAWPADLLVAYIVKTHHRYIREKGPILQTYLEKLEKVHGAHHPELFEINKLFTEAVLDLNHHLEKEERILFPFIEAMETSKDLNEEIQTPVFGTVRNPIRLMLAEHEAEGDRFERIRALSNDYQVPADACGTYRVAFEMLSAFEQDLHKHIHLENNILFPKSIQMEESIH